MWDVGIHFTFPKLFLEMNTFFCASPLYFSRVHLRTHSTHMHAHWNCSAEPACPYNIPSAPLLRRYTAHHFYKHSLFTSNQCEYDGDTWLPSRAACLLKSNNKRNCGKSQFSTVSEIHRWRKSAKNNNTATYCLKGTRDITWSQ